MADETPDDTTPPMNLEPVGPTPDEEARAAKMQPIRDLVGSDAFAEVLTGLQAIHNDYRDEALGYSHLYGVMDIMPRLKAWAEAS